MPAASSDNRFPADQPELRWKSSLFREIPLERAEEPSFCATLKEAFEIVDDRKGKILLVTRMRNRWGVFTYKGKLHCKVDFDKIRLDGLSLDDNQCNPRTYIVNDRGDVARMIYVEDRYRLEEIDRPTTAFRPNPEELQFINDNKINKKKIVVDFMEERARTWDEEHEQKMVFKIYSNFTVLVAHADDINKVEESFNEQVVLAGTSSGDFQVSSIPLREFAECEKGKMFIITYPSVPGIFNFVFGEEEIHDVKAGIIGRCYRMDDWENPEGIFNHNI